MYAYDTFTSCLTNMSTKFLFLILTRKSWLFLLTQNVLHIRKYQTCLNGFLEVLQFINANWADET